MMMLWVGLGGLIGGGFDKSVGRGLIMVLLSGQDLVGGELVGVLLVGFSGPGLVVHLVQVDRVPPCVPK